MRTLSLLFAMSLGLVAAACGSDDPCAGHTHDPMCLVCTQDDHDSFAAGSVKEGVDGNLAVEIVSATPTPHVEGNNQLVVVVMDGSDQPMTGVTFDLVETFYPAGHGTPIVPEVTELGNGEYEITLINYVHSGVWTLTMELTAGSVTDTIEYEFCIEEDPSA